MTFTNSILALVEKHELAPHNLTFEITESLIVEEMDQVSDALGGTLPPWLSNRTGRFCTGYSSLSYLYCSLVNTLKIDKSFIRNINLNSDAKILTKAIVAMAHSLSLKVVAEGIETNKELIDARAKCIAIMPKVSIIASHYPLMNSAFTSSSASYSHNRHS
ncbi:MAG: EAL domain-containing protein [Pseudomonadales bacterium]